MGWGDSDASVLMLNAKAMPRPLRGGTEENHENMFWLSGLPIFETLTSRMRSRSAVVLTSRTNG
jgi:hypothetical protein